MQQHIERGGFGGRKEGEVWQRRAQEITQNEV